MIVDDDADLRVVLRQMREDAGHAVGCAEHGLYAPALIGSGPTRSLTLLDVSLPGLDGWGFPDARRLDASLLEVSS